MAEVYLNGRTPRGYEGVKALAKEIGIKIPDLLVLSRNNDPFFCGQPAQVEKAEWFAGIWDKFNLGSGVHLRRIHYRLISQEEPMLMPTGEPYLNTDKCWDYICGAGKFARHLRLIEADLFVDKRNPDPVINVEYGEREWCRAIPPDPRDLGFNLPTIPYELGSSLDLNMPDIQHVSGYEYAGSEQPYHVEVWIEKSTMDDILLPICKRHGVNLVGGKGFQSITSAVNLLERIKTSGKPARILYISDFDPGGEGMPVSVSRHLEYWIGQYAEGADIALQSIALTLDQVREYDLPPSPIKDSDLRAGAFLDRHGVTGATELDALEALHPGQLAKIVEAEIEPYRDSNLSSKFFEAKSEAWRLAQEAWRKQTAEQRNQLRELDADATAILAQYENELTGLSERLAADFAPIKERLQSVRYAVQDAAYEFNPDLPALPKPDAHGQDTGDWLFNSGRTYGEQLAIYQARKAGKVA